MKKKAKKIDLSPVQLLIMIYTSGEEWIRTINLPKANQRDGGAHRSKVPFSDPFRDC